MPTQGRLVDSADPQMPFYVNDHGQDSLFSITIASGEGVLVAGTVLGKITASGLYAAYDNGAVDGTEVAAGILLNRVDATSENVLASMMIHGVVRIDELTGYDAAAATDLAGSIEFV